MRIGNLVIIVLLVLIAFFLGMQVSNNEDASKDLSVDEGQEANEFNITDIGASDGGDAGRSHDSIGTNAVRQGNDLYTFDTISFSFSSAKSIPEGQPSPTQLRFFFDNFKRNGQPIALSGFRLGLYDGKCQEGGGSLDDPLPSGKVLGYAQCLSVDSGSQIVLSLNGKFVVASLRDIGNLDAGPWKELIKIDLSQLVE